MNWRLPPDVVLAMTPRWLIVSDRRAPKWVRADSLTRVRV
jgi:hypothetical protein